MFDSVFSLNSLLLFGIGIITGTASAAFGIGGGIITVPLLILLFNFNGNESTATSLGLIIFTTLAGTIAYFREKRVDLKMTLFFMMYAIPGSIGGAMLSRSLQTTELKIDIFQLLFAILMICIAGFKIITLFLKKSSTNKMDAYVPSPEELAKPWWARKVLISDIVDKRGVHFKYNVKLYPGVIIAFLGGFAGALLGLGGGVIYVPVLTMVLGIPLGVAAAISTFTIFIANFAAVSLRFAFIKWDYVLFLGIGTVLAAMIVPRFLHKIKSEAILVGFWIVVITTALRLLVKIFFA